MKSTASHHPVIQKTRNTTCVIGGLVTDVSEGVVHRTTTPPPPTFSDWSWVSVKKHADLDSQSQLDAASLHESISNPELIERIEVLSHVSLSAHTLSSILPAISSNNVHSEHTCPLSRESCTPIENAGIVRDECTDIHLFDAQNTQALPHQNIPLHELVMHRIAQHQIMTRQTPLLSVNDTTAISSPLEGDIVVTKSGAMGEFNYFSAGQQHLSAQYHPITMDKCSSSTPSTYSFVSRTNSPAQYVPSGTIAPTCQTPVQFVPTIRTPSSSNVPTNSSGSQQGAAGNIVHDFVAEFETCCAKRSFAEDILALLDRHHQHAQQIQPETERMVENTHLEHMESYLIPLVMSEIIERDEVIDMPALQAPQQDVVVDVPTQQMAQNENPNGQIEKEGGSEDASTTMRSSCPRHEHQLIAIKSKKLKLFVKAHNHLKRCKKHASHRKPSMNVVAVIRQTLCLLNAFTPEEIKILVGEEWSFMKIVGFVAAFSVSGFIFVKTGMLMQRGLAYLASYLV